MKMKVHLHIIQLKGLQTERGIVITVHENESSSSFHNYLKIKTLNLAHMNQKYI